MKHLRLYESWKQLNKRQEKLDKEEVSLLSDTQNEIRKRLKEFLGDNQEMTIQFPKDDEILYGKKMSEDDEICFNEWDLENNEDWCVVDKITYNKEGYTRIYHYSEKYGKTDWPIGGFEKSRSLITILGYLESLGTHDEYWAKEEGEAMGFFSMK